MANWLDLGIKTFNGNRALEETWILVGYEASETSCKGAFSAATGSCDDNEFSGFHC